MSALAGGSALSVVITRYLALKTALGRRYALERRVLETLTAFLQPLTGSPRDLTPDTFTTWAQTLQRLTPTVRRNHLRIVRNLCLYRRGTEPACFVPDLALFPAPHQPRAPYIFTAREIAKLLRATSTLLPGAAGVAPPPRLPPRGRPPLHDGAPPRRAPPVDAGGLCARRARAPDPRDQVPQIPRGAAVAGHGARG